MGQDRDRKRRAVRATWPGPEASPRLPASFSLPPLLSGFRASLPLVSPPPFSAPCPSVLPFPPFPHSDFLGPSLPLPGIGAFACLKLDTQYSAGIPNSMLFCKGLQLQWEGPVCGGGLDNAEQKP